MFGLGSLGLVCSVHSRRVLTAVACTYLLAIPLAIGLGCVGGCCLPFLQVATDIGVNFVLGSLAAVETMLGLVCCWLATAEIAAQRQAPWPPRRQPSAGWGYVEISSETLPGPDRSDPVPTRPPDSLVHWTQARLGRWLGTRPLLWKEVRGSFSPVLGIVLLGVIWCTLPLALSDSLSMTVWLQVVTTALAGLMCFLATCRAAVSVVRERERRTLDRLLALPVERSALLAARWQAAVLSTWPLAAGLLVLWLAALLLGYLNLLALPLLGAAALVYSVFSALLGLYFSTVCRSSMSALVWSLLAFFVVAVGPWLLPTNALTWLPARVLPGEAVAWLELILVHGLTPPMPLWVFGFQSVHELAEPAGAGRLLAAAAGVVLYALAAILLWHATNQHFHRW
jgi:hypothetical protein